MKQLVVISFVLGLVVTYMVSMGKVPPQWIVAHKVIVPPMGRGARSNRPIWVGNNNILIEGFPKLINQYPNMDAIPNKDIGIFQWNIQTKKLTTIVSDSSGTHISPANICYSDGRFSFWDQAPPNSVIYTGTLEKFDAIRSYSQYSYSYYDCKVYDKLKFEKENEVNATKLRDGDGIIQREECHPRAPSNNCIYKYIRDGVEVGTFLDFRYFSYNDTQYLEYAKAYINTSLVYYPLKINNKKNIESSLERTKKSLPCKYNTTVLYTTPPRVEHDCIPESATKILGKPRGIFRTKDALFAWSDGKGTRGSGSGLYIYKYGYLFPIIKGRIKDPMVSPDGCKIVFGYAPNNYEFFNNNGIGFRVLDLCVD